MDPNGLGCMDPNGLYKYVTGQLGVPLSHSSFSSFYLLPPPHNVLQATSEDSALRYLHRFFSCHGSHGWTTFAQVQISWWINSMGTHTRTQPSYLGVVTYYLRLKNLKT